ncbi:glycosyltransferase family 25 protein [Alteraurantiacibacter aquimixticola]|uniref:Glycosyltransferase family 25 protein n=1 Tax=Alteraurantiacibacter aquimixticola TaxID=2489173 RepID=A0A4T3F8A1_9SPHN|nr:glycosyltransferase family 25 protein [Alteraurantiacibacter aquimixticola]TIX51240.1 glycosyltransferase family 25 protein [Alteraurantiacibacter aquimixticola]
MLEAKQVEPMEAPVPPAAAEQPARRVQVRVVSFADAAERRARLTESISKVDCDWSFFDVVPAEGLPVAYDEAKAYETYGSVLSAAERSCAASHIAMMEEFVAKGTSDYLLCMEDDVLLDPYVRLDAMAGFMALCDVHFMRLYARFFVPANFLGAVGRMAFYRATWPALGTQCFLLSRAGATRLLESFHSTGLIAPIDVMLDGFWRTDMPVVVAYPFPAIELGLPSSIHNNRTLVDERNDALRASIGPRPTRRAKLGERVARAMANRKFRSFDKKLEQRIKENISALHTAFHG